MEQKKKRLLLIDDEEDFCFLVKINLEKTGEFDVLTTTSPHEGVELARQKQPDLILLDILMPEMEGGDVAAMLLEDARTSRIPIIFVSAIVGKDDAGNQTLKRIGGRYFISKPVQTADLVASINKILG